MAEAVVSFVAEQLGEFIIQEGKFLYGVSDQVECAQRELRLMRGFLKDADARQREEERVRIWVAEIRDTAYDLEDVIEIFAMKVASKRKGGIKNVLQRITCCMIEGVHLHTIGSGIGKITDKISGLTSSLQTYNIRIVTESEGATSWHERRKQLLRRTYSHVVDRDVVGLKDIVEELVMHLVKDENCHRVVSIWGMGGLGKSTLAKQIYHHTEVRRHFSGFAWVCISKHFEVRNVWQEILVKLISATEGQRNEIAQMSNDEIAKKLYLVQQDKRCLVVLDDVWSTEALDSLKAAFPYEETKSKMLITTRGKSVALHVETNGFLYEPQPLNENESWTLLEKIAISGKHDIDSKMYGRMKELGRKMLQHCKGLPLAITVLAGLLAKKDTDDDWDAVHKNVYKNISRGHGQEQQFAGTSWLLELSYDDLPYHLKPCFLYLGAFLEDSEIPVKRLTQLWIAEGFISLGNQKRSSLETLEDVAYTYLSELVERCMVQVGTQGSVRKIKTCRIHDLMRELCLFKAEEENFLQVVNFSDRNKVIGTARRLAIYLDTDADKLVPSTDERDGRLRSLLYFGSKEWMPKGVVGSIFKDFKLLRVLKLENLDGEMGLPAEIGSMVHLRFLSLRKSNNITGLPSSLGNLICLQTLDLNFYWSDSVEEIIPNVLWKMEQLRHLYLPRDYSSRSRLKLSTLQNLQTLSGVSGYNFDFCDLTKLTSLRKLDMETRDDGSLTLSSTSTTLPHIQSLRVQRANNQPEDLKQIVLSCRHVFKLMLWGTLNELPTELLHFPNLSKLWLTLTNLRADQMAILEKLPNLKTLRLSSAFDAPKFTMVCSKGGFRHLESLFLQSLMQLDEWRAEEEAMPRLCRLRIDSCIQLKTVPDRLRYITTLRELAINWMPTKFCSKLKEGGEDFYKIQHVPSLVLGEPWN